MTQKPPEPCDQWSETLDNFRIFFDLCPDFLFVLDMEGRIILVNRTVITLLGYSNEELEGTSVLLLHPEDRRNEAGVIVGEMVAGRRDFCPIPLLARDGREVPVETRVVLGRWNGEPCLFGYSRNLTELKASEEKFRSAFESSTVLMAISTLEDGRFLDVNQAFTDTMGYEGSQVIGKSSLELGLIQDPRDRMEMTRRLKEHHKVNNMAIGMRDVKGKIVSGLFSAAIMKGSSGETLLLTAMNDITDLKETERRLRESEERLQLTLSGADLGTWDWDMPTGNVRFNRRWVEMLGYAPEEIEPHVRTWEKLLHPEDAAPVMEALQRHLDGETDAYQTEHRLRSKSGAWVWVLDSGRVIRRDAAGAPVRVAGIHMDITARKQAEAALQQHRERLEELVRERTRQLEQTQKKLLAWAVEAGRVLSLDIMLHNIGNAVTPILLQTDRLAMISHDQPLKYLQACYRDLCDHKGELDHYLSRDPRGMEVFSYMGRLLNTFETEHQEKSGEVISAIQNAVGHISQILRVQSLPEESDGMKERMDVSGVVESALQIQGPSLHKRGIRVRTELESGMVITADRNNMIQVIMNLIKNAYESLNGPGQKALEKEIFIRSFMEETTACLEICDNGIGFGSADQDVVFETGMSEKGSSGLGLFYCKTIMEANGGAISFKSDGEGKGATVRLEFGKDKWVVDHRDES